MHLAQCIERRLSPVALISQQTPKSQPETAVFLRHIRTKGIQFKLACGENLEATPPPRTGRGASATPQVILDSNRFFETEPEASKLDFIHF